ncbi:hypothetical protein NL676_016587 [Syzygium grande]|nr:hypothetical protein NL676_016587 [Syzygium grande]
MTKDCFCQVNIFAPLCLLCSPFSFFRLLRSISFDPPHFDYNTRVAFNEVDGKFSLDKLTSQAPIFTSVSAPSRPRSQCSVGLFNTTQLADFAYHFLFGADNADRDSFGDDGLAFFSAPVGHPFPPLGRWISRICLTQPPAIHPEIRSSWLISTLTTTTENMIQQNLTRV